MVHGGLKTNLKIQGLNKLRHLTDVVIQFIFFRAGVPRRYIHTLIHSVIQI